MTTERPRRQRGRGDIEPVERIDLALEDWRDSAAALGRLHEWAQRQTAEAIRWYLEDKRIKRLGSKLLRAAAVILAVAGGLVPLVAAGGRVASIGYVLLALAAGCVAFDHFFGLSSGWMRDIVAAQALQARLTRYQVAWATWQASEAGLLKPDSDPEEAASGVQRALDLIDGLMSDVRQITENETAQWVSDFSSSIAALRQQAGPSGTAAAVAARGDDANPPGDPAQPVRSRR